MTAARHRDAAAPALPARWPGHPGGAADRSPAGYDPELAPSDPLPGTCGASDGFSACTEPPGHGPVHWDRRTRHEWHDDEDERYAEAKAENDAAADLDPGWPGHGPEE